MPQGLQMYDAAGQLLVDVGDWLGRLAGSTPVSANTSGSVTNDLISTGTPFFVWIPADEEPVTGPAYVPSVSFSGNVMSWGSNPIAGTLVYGVR